MSRICPGLRIGKVNGQRGFVGPLSGINLSRVRALNSKSRPETEGLLTADAQLDGPSATSE